MPAESQPKHRTGGEATLVLPPETDFATLARAIEATGLNLADTEHFDDGPDPDRALWTGAAGHVTLIHDLATGNRLLVAHPASALPTAIDAIPEVAILAGLRGTDPRSLLAAIQAAQHHPSSPLDRALARRVSHSDPHVSAAARDAALARAFGPGERPETDAGAALFAVPGWRSEKLQVMRWMMREKDSCADDLVPMLHRALTDPDWEIAATALLVAGHRQIVSLADPVRDMTIPTSSADGLTRDEHALIRALRDAYLLERGEDGKRLPHGVSAALAGYHDDLPETLRPLIFALTTPLPDDVPPPPPHPLIQMTAAGPELPDGCLLSWVPAVPHLLGDPGLKRPSPMRYVTPEKGFYIESETRPSCSREAARAEVQKLSAEWGHPLALPTPDDWEMAARGPDGRRFLSGMRAEKRPTDLSPWGLSGICTGPGEWLDGPALPEQAPVAGGARHPALAERRFADPATNHGFRLILPV